MSVVLQDKLKAYLKRERSYLVSEAVAFKKLALDEFFAYLDESRGEGWHIDATIQRRTIRDYIAHLESKGREANYIVNAFKSVQDFIIFGLDMGWIKEYEVWKKEKK